jgi:hypothetical protein
MLPWYCTREDVRNSLEITQGLRTDRLIDSKIASSSRSVEGQLHRPVFAPTLATVKFDWPDYSYSPSWALELDSNEIIELVAVVSNGTDITSSCILRRGDDRSTPPYNRIEIDLSTNAAFAASTTFQQAVHVTALYGYSNDEEVVGELDATLAGTASATATITWSTADLGVGDLLHIDSERMIVTDRTWVDSGQTITDPLTASKASVAVNVSSGSAFAAGEIVIVDVERMLIVDVVGNTLSVIRQYDGTVLAAHADNAPIFALTGVILARAQLGTTIAPHAPAASISRWITPANLREFTKAESIVALEQDASAWNRTAGSGDNAREASGKALADAREMAIQSLGRKYRLGAI